MLATTRERESNTITLASNADVQKQIEALKQENELLELQQKNEALKRRESSAEIAEQIEAIKAENEALKAKKAENNKIIKKGFLGFCRGKYSPTGCFIGGELGLAIQTEHYLWDAKTPKESENDYISGVPEKQTLNIPINLTFGYQWYYMQSQGIRIKANVGYANYNTTIIANNQYGQEYWKYPIATHAVQYGLELAWLWDFVRKGKHTLGVNLGTGFEGMSYFSEMDFGGNVMPKENYTKIAAIVSLGLHYYFNVNHQIGLGYIYKDYTGVKGAKMEIKEYNYVVGKLSIAPRNQILLSYAYKF